MIRAYCVRGNVSECHLPGLEWHWENVGKAKGASTECRENKDPESLPCYAQNYPSLFQEYCKNNLHTCDIDGLVYHWRTSGHAWENVKTECPITPEQLRCYASNYPDLREQYCPGPTTGPVVKRVDVDDLSACDLDGLKWHW